MTLDPHMAEVFPAPPMVAHTRPQNIRDKLIKAKLPPKTRKRRSIPGMHKCNKARCNICPFVKQTKEAKATKIKKTVPLTREYNCQTHNLVYLVTCTKCAQQYVGETKHTLAHRGNQHLGYIRNKNMKQATGRHFNKKGHKIEHFTIQVLESINTPDAMYRKNRESLFIQQFDLIRKGMNGKA